MPSALQFIKLVNKMYRQKSMIWIFKSYCEIIIQIQTTGINIKTVIFFFQFKYVPPFYISLDDHRCIRWTLIIYYYIAENGNILFYSEIKLDFTATDK